MTKSLDARIAYYLRKVNENVQSFYTMDPSRRAHRHRRLLRYKVAMHHRIRAAGWKDA